MKRFEKATNAAKQPTLSAAELEFYPHFYTWPDSDQKAFNDLLTKAAQADPIDPEACKEMLDIARRNGTPDNLKFMTALKIITNQ